MLALRSTPHRQDKNLRYSQVSPSDMFTEKNTGSNLPAQIELYHAGAKAPYANEYNFLFVAKGGGSANKTFLSVKPRRRREWAG